MKPGLVVEILKYEGGATGHGDVTYVTSTAGTSRSGHVLEFVLGLDAAHDEVVVPMAELGARARETAFHRVVTRAPRSAGDRLPA